MTLKTSQPSKHPQLKVTFRLQFGQLLFLLLSVIDNVDNIFFKKSFNIINSCGSPAANINADGFLNATMLPENNLSSHCSPNFNSKCKKVIQTFWIKTE